MNKLPRINLTPASKAFIFGLFEMFWLPILANVAVFYIFKEKSWIFFLGELFAIVKILWVDYKAIKNRLPLCSEQVFFVYSLLRKCTI